MEEMLDEYNAERRKIRTLPELCEMFGYSNTPTLPCEFIQGEVALYTNEFGVSFVVTILGFSEPDTLRKNAFIHTIHSHREISVDAARGSAHWFSITPDRLTKIVH